MAETTYDYSIYNDFPNHKVDPSRLQQEIRASAITIALSGVSTDGDLCAVKFKDELSTEAKSILDGIVAAHSGEPLPQKPLYVRQADATGLDPDTALNNTEFIEVTVKAGQAMSFENFTKPFPIDAVAARYVGGHPEQEWGDKFDVFGIAAGDPAIGAVTAPVTAGNKVVPVNSTVFTYVRHGLYVKFGDADEEYRVESVDAEGGTITLMSDLQSDVATLAEIRVRRPFVTNGWVYKDILYPIGDLTSGASILKANDILRIRMYPKTTPTSDYIVPFALITLF